MCTMGRIVSRWLNKWLNNGAVVLGYIGFSQLFASTPDNNVLGNEQEAPEATSLATWHFLLIKIRIIPQIIG